MSERGPHKSLRYTDEWLPAIMRPNPVVETVLTQTITFDPAERYQELLQYLRCRPFGAGNDDGDPTAHVEAQISALLEQYPDLLESVKIIRE